MKTFQIKSQFLETKKGWLFLLGIPFLWIGANSFLETSLTKTSFLFSSRNSRTFVASFRPFEAERSQTQNEASTSVWSKIFGGIGSFFALIGTGFATGVTETAKFLGWVIALPVTGTIALFARNQADSKASGGSDSARSG